MASWESKNQEFVKALEIFEHTLPALTEKKLKGVSKEQRDLMVCLVVCAFECLRLAMQSGPDRLGAVKLVLQVSGLMNGLAKVPEPPKTPPASGFPASQAVESLQL